MSYKFELTKKKTNEKNESLLLRKKFPQIYEKNLLSFFHTLNIKPKVSKLIIHTWFFVN